MQRFVLTQNLVRFRTRLAETSDEATRRSLAVLLAETERELALLNATREGVARPAESASPEAVEAARAAMVDWFRQEFSESPRLAALIDPAPGLTMIEVNRTYELGSGLSRDEIVGQALFSLFPDNPDDPAANGIHNLYTSLRKVAETGREDATPLQRYDVRDEAGQFVERYWRQVNTPLHDDDGNLILLLHVVEEATDEVRGEGTAR